MPFNYAICLVSIFVLIVFFISKQLGNIKLKQIYDELFQQADLLCENQNTREELHQFLKKAQQLTNTTPELTLKIIRRYLSMPPSDTEKNLFSPPQQAAIILTCLNARSIKKLFKHKSTPLFIIIVFQNIRCRFLLFYAEFYSPVFHKTF